jgi:hypothetical protein
MMAVAFGSRCSALKWVERQRNPPTRCRTPYFLESRHPGWATHISDVGGEDTAARISDDFGTKLKRALDKMRCLNSCGDVR